MLSQRPSFQCQNKTEKESSPAPKKRRAVLFSLLAFWLSRTKSAKLPPALPEV